MFHRSLKIDDDEIWESHNILISSFNRLSIDGNDYPSHFLVFLPLKVDSGEGTVSPSLFDITIVPNPYIYYLNYGFESYQEKMNFVLHNRIPNASFTISKPKRIWII